MSELDPNWDPMKDDFYSKDFNCYDKGIGRDLPQSKQSPHNSGHSGSPGQENVSLYIQGIPNEMTNEGLKNLFSKAGKVINAYKKVSKREGNDTFGFVEFSTSKEAELAIRKFDKYTIEGGRYRLKVQVSLSADEKHRREKKKQEEEEFLKSLNSNREDPGYISSNEAKTGMKGVGGTQPKK